VLEAYAHEVIPVLDRAEWLYQYWLEQSRLFSDGEKLGNVAAIHRWEATTMERSLERVKPPSALSDAHERVLNALDLASRAAQLLSSGSRFHNANALCEGQSLLDVSRERRMLAIRAMRKYLVPRPAPVQTLAAGLASSSPETGLPSGALPPDSLPPAATPAPPTETSLATQPPLPQDTPPGEEAS
jgi:hypothetical protein